MNNYNYNTVYILTIALSFFCIAVKSFVAFPNIFLNSFTSMSYYIQMTITVHVYIYSITVHVYILYYCTCIIYTVLLYMYIYYITVHV